MDEHYSNIEVVEEEGDGRKRKYCTVEACDQRSDVAVLLRSMRADAHLTQY